MSGPPIDHDHSAAEVGRRTAKGAVATVASQGANFVLRFLSMIVIARLVTPEHFGLVGMVTAVTGLLNLFRDAGLSSATVQRPSMSEELLSSLFWINLAVGIVLTMLTCAAAPFIAAFYGDERLTWITIALACGFFLHGVMAQHRALLQRQLRFGALGVIDTAALLASIGLGVGLASAGYGYWALIFMALGQPLFQCLGVLALSRWLPLKPQRAAGLVSMLQFGGYLSLNSFVVYVAYNADKVLLGRLFGAEVLGIYGRAYQLISLPTDNLNSTLSSVMLPALARVQGNPADLRAMFLTGFGMFLSVITPITAACALFADEIVHVALGPQWDQAVPIFRLLAPTVFTLSVINPLGILMLASGLARRSLTVALLIAPVVITGYVLGLPYGAKGVALGYSVAMVLLIFPVLYWTRRGTLISMSDLAKAIAPPCVATALGAAVALVVESYLLGVSELSQLVILTFVLFSTHFLILAFGFKHKKLYVQAWRQVGG